MKEWIIVCALPLLHDMLVDEEIRKSQLERKVENGELANFGEKYTGQFDKEFYTADEKGSDLSFPD